MNKYLDYLYSRGLSNKTIKDFGLGFCNQNGGVSHPEYKPFIDFRFYNGVLFPIRDLYGNLIAVSSRNIDTKNYIHSKYTKKLHLYGLDVTHKNILQKNKVYIVEGNFDLLTLYEHGITNAIAMLGSKLSLSQISLLARFAEEFIIATDGDKAGKDCAVKLIEMLNDNNVVHKQLSLPTGSDPDSLIRESGADAFLGLKPPDLLERIRGIDDRRNQQRIAYRH